MTDVSILIKSIEKDMSALYLQFCMPRVTLNTTNGRVTINYEWTNKRAEALHHKLSELLSECYRIDRQAAAEKQKLFYRDYQP